MSRHVLVAGGVVLAGQFALAAPALALTPEEAWGQLKGFLEESGYATEADVEPYKDGLIVNQLKLTLSEPDGTGTDAVETITTGAITFLPDAAAPDSVSIAPVQPWSYEIRSSNPGGDILTTGSYTSDDMSLVASGTPEDITYTSNSPDATLSFSTTDPADGSQFATGSLQLADMAGTTQIKQGDENTLTTDVTIGSITVDSTITPPEDAEDNQPVTLNLTMNGLDMDSAATMAGGLPTATMADRIAAGMTSTSTLLFDSLQGQATVEEDGDKITMTMASGAGSMGSTVKDGLFGYDSTTKEIALGVTGKSLPMPIMLSIASTSAALSGPMVPTDEAEPFSMHFDVTDASVPDMAWAMIDPENALPRDPVTVSATLSGEGKLLVDPSDPMAFAALPSGKPPIEVDNLTIDQLLVQGLGAEVTAKGQLSVDNDATSKFGDFPQVTGTVDIAANGVMDLIQTLSKAGVIPPQQAMMIPMFAGMFTREVSGPDDLATTIEITPDQSLLINGQPLMP